MEKFRKSGLSNRLENEIKFVRTNGRYNDKNIQNVNILSRHKKRILHWNNEYRNKYACDRWIQDSRGCGYGCLVSKKRFRY